MYTMDQTILFFILDKYSVFEKIGLKSIGASSTLLLSGIQITGVKSDNESNEALIELYMGQMFIRTVE